MSLVEFIVTDIIPYYDPNTYIITPENVESFIYNPITEGWNRLVVTGFNREPHWYVRVYNVCRQYCRQYQRKFVIVNPVYIPLDLGDNYDVIISIYGYYRVLVIYDSDRVDRLIDRYRQYGSRILVISDTLPESDIVVHPINQHRYYHNVDVIIDNTMDPKSVMEERIYLFEPSFDKIYIMVRNISEKDYQQLPIYPELDIVQSHTTWIDTLLNPSPYQEPSGYSVKSGYERYYVQLEHYNTFHRRFTGKDDIDTLVNIWNIMVDEVSDIYNIQQVTRWSRCNYIDPSWMLKLVTLGDTPSGKVNYDDIVFSIDDDQPIYYRVSDGIYRSRGDWYYRSNLIPFSDIDIKPVPIIKRITSRLAIVV
jgi:hypothetical protein